jgi:hypothetical protein
VLISAPVNSTSCSQEGYKFSIIILCVVLPLYQVHKRTLSHIPLAHVCCESCSQSSREYRISPIEPKTDEVQVKAARTSAQL